MSSDEYEEDARGVREWLADAPDTIADVDTDYGPVFSGDRVPDRDPTGTNPWLPRGPGNVGGRVRAFAVDTELIGGRPRALYAGAASGGVFRSLDDGLSWHSIWDHGMPSMAIGAIAVGSAGGTRYVWVGTGEVGRLRGNGVYRLTLPAGADGPVVWERMGTAAEMMGTGAEPYAIEAAAVDPDDGTVCWFVGPTGIYRHRAGAWSAWPLPTPAATNRNSPGASDVKFMHTAHGRYVVVAAAHSAWGDLLLITDPDATQIEIRDSIAAATIGAAAARAALAQPLYPAAPAAPAAALPSRRAHNAKLAIVPDAAGDRVYVAYGTSVRLERTFRENPLLALCRSTVSRVGATPQWAAPTMWAMPQGYDAQLQDQSDYNLVLAARPGTPPGPGTDVIVLGMVDLAISVDSGTTFAPHGNWNELFNRRIDYHSDHHAAVMETGRTRMWIATDGGVAFSDTYVTAAGAVVDTAIANWRRRMAGLVAGQVYDLTQHPLSDAASIALQDLGGWRSSGSTTWRHVLWGDGLAMAADPYDPYHTVASSHRGAYDLRFDGAVDIPWTKPAGRRALNRGALRLRALESGIMPEDEGAFEDTIAHPHVPGHLLHLRKKRLYQSRDGENWRIVPVGDRFELLFRLTVPALAAPGAPPVPVPQMLAGIMVRFSGTAALKLGFLPGETSRLVETAGQPVGSQTYDLRLISSRSAPAVAAADRLDITIEVVTGSFTAPNRFLATWSVVFPAAEADFGALLALIAATIKGQIGADWRPFGAAAAAPNVLLPGGASVTMWTLPAFSGWPSLLELVSDASGAAVDLTIGGTGGATLCGAGSFRGEAGRPAVVTLRPDTVLAVGDTITVTARRTPPAPPPPAPPPAPVALGGTATLTITDYLNQGFFRQASQLAGRLERARQQGNGAFAVWASSGKKWVRLRTGRTNPATPITATLAGNAVARLFATAPARPAVLFDLRPPGDSATYDLSGLAAPVRLTLTETAGGFTRNIDFVAADFVGGLGRATPEEVRVVIERVLTGPPAPPPANDWVVEVQRELEGDGPSEAAYSPFDPRVMWVGAMNLLFVSTDGGDHWRNVFPSTVPPDDGSTNFENILSIEAIAPEAFPPADPANPIYAALVGTRGNAALYRFTTAAADNRTDLPGVSLPSEYGGRDARTFALVADPRRRGVYYAGTDVGVFRSDDHGGSWSAFSVGLPHGPCVDLALDAGLDTLRVAMFGRGLYEKYLGDGAPPLPEVFFHASPRDAGRRPIAHGVDLDSDTPADVDAAQSPDLCLTSMDADDRARLDAIELERVRHEVARRDVDFHLLMRPHNRTGIAIDDAQVIALWAPVEGEVPPLPDTLWTAAAAGPVAPGATHGEWRALGSAAVPSLPPGGGRLVSLPIRWDANLDRRDRIALVAIVRRGTAVPSSSTIDATSLLLRDARVGLRLTPVRRDDGFVTLRVIGPATGTVAGVRLTAIASARNPAAALTPTALQFAAIAAPGPQTARSTAAGPFDVTDLIVTLSYHETLVTQQPTYPPPPAPQAAVPPTALRDPPAGDFTFDIDFREGGFAHPAAVPAAQVRAFMASRLRQLNRLLVVEDAVVALSLQRSPTDARARRGGASWQGGALVVTAAGAAVTDADFAPAALAAPARVAIGAAQRFTVRVWNHGDLDVAAPDTTVRLFWLDPHTDAPDPHPLGGAQQVAIAAGRHADVWVEDTIAAISHDDVLILAEVDHPADQPRPRTFDDWGKVRQWGADSDNTMGRLLRRS